MIDDARTLPAGATLETELCIVGAGELWPKLGDGVIRRRSALAF